MKQKAIRRKQLNCCLCGTRIADRRTACSAHPLKDGECCQRCDDLKVTPARLAQRGIPIEEAKTIGKNIRAAVKFARQRALS